MRRTEFARPYAGNTRPMGRTGRRLSRLLATALPAVAALVITSAAPPAAATPRAPAITRLAVYNPAAGGPRLRSPLALARDSHNGDLLVTSFENGQVVIFDDAGAVIKTIGGESGLANPYGVALGADGRIYVSEVQSGLIKVLSPAGSKLDEFDLSALTGQPVSPGRLAVGEDGRIYTVDLRNHLVLVLTAEGSLVASLGPLPYPQKAGPGPDGTVIALSAQGDAVNLYDITGNLTTAFGKHGDASPGHVSFPTGFAVDARGRIWLADAFQHRLKVFAADGRFLFNYGRMEEESGGFFFPVDLCFADDGRLFVVEKGADRIQVFKVDDLPPPGAS